MSERIYKKALVVAILSGLLVVLLINLAIILL